MPCSPHAAAGDRTEPPASEPKANMTVPAATLAPAPVEEPPVEWPVFQRFRATSNGRSWCMAPVPYSQVLSLPSRMVPAAWSLHTAMAVPLATWSSRRREAPAVATPSTS